MMKSSQEILRQAVQVYLNQKKRDQGRFSYSDFERESGFRKGELWKFLKGRRVVRVRAATKYFKPIVEPQVWERALDAFTREREGVETAKVVYLFERTKGDRKVVQSEDQREFVSDPLHHAALHCFELEDFQPSWGWMAGKLRISEGEIGEILERMCRLKLIEREGPFFRRLPKRVMSSDDLESDAPNENRRRILKFIEQGIELPRSERDFFNWYCALDPSDLPELRRVIRRVVAQFDRRQRISKPKRVYVWMSSLVPLSD